MNGHHGPQSDGMISARVWSSDEAIFRRYLGAEGFSGIPPSAGT
jgi:hypothetical protein